MDAEHEPGECAHFYNIVCCPGRLGASAVLMAAEGAPKGGRNTKSVVNGPVFLVVFRVHGTRSAIPRVRQQAAILAAPATSPAGRRKLGEGDGGQG